MFEKRPRSAGDIPKQNITHAIMWYSGTSLNMQSLQVVSMQVKSQIIATTIYVYILMHVLFIVNGH